MDNRCRYTRINGARCTMPALHNRDLCFQHEERRRLARSKPVVPETHNACPLVTFCYMDDHDSILANLNAIAEAFSRNMVDHRQVGALTYLMQTCLKTLRQMKELEAVVRAEDAVRQVEYAADGSALAADTPDPAPLTLPAVTACADPTPPPCPENDLFSDTYVNTSTQTEQNQTLAKLWAVGPGARRRAAAAQTPQPASDARKNGFKNTKMSPKSSPSDTKNGLKTHSVAPRSPASISSFHAPFSCRTDAADRRGRHAVGEQHLL